MDPGVVMAEHMSGLLAFKKRVEDLLAGADGTGAETLADLRKEVADLSEHVAALQVSKDEAESFSDRLHNMLTWFEANKGGLEVLLSIGDGLPPHAAQEPASFTIQPVEAAATQEPPAAAAAAPAAGNPAT